MEYCQEPWRHKGFASFAKAAAALVKIDGESKLSIASVMFS
jgi:hypothetical protein